MDREHLFIVRSKDAEGSTPIELATILDSEVTAVLPQVKGFAAESYEVSA